MTDYTPTTEEIQSRYVYAADFTVNEEVDAWGEFDRWLAAHDAEVRAAERDKAATDAIIRAFTVMRAHEFLVRRILTEMEDTDYDAISNRVIEYLIHAIDMDAENAAAARGDGEQA